MLQNPHALLTFGKVQNPLRLPHKIMIKHPTVVRTCGAFTIFTSKCASRHNGVQFLNISTSKSAPQCFEHFDFKTCHPPQPRALLEHLNIQKLSQRGVLSF